MKIALICDSLLLQQTLQRYLKCYIVTKEDAELMISDRLIRSNKPVFLIGHTAKADLVIPFTKEHLLDTLHTFYETKLDDEISLNSKEEMKPFIERLNKKHHNKIAKLARKIS
ncbi:MAG: hypothetical protein K0U47_09625 [Epsilonproteobacteria bacterium]|nr:hypothetical protein [Campylobacterota bacterium]